MTVTALLQRLRIWCAQRLLDLGLIEAAKRVAPEAERGKRVYLVGKKSRAEPGVWCHCGKLTT